MRKGSSLAIRFPIPKHRPERTKTSCSLVLVFNVRPRDVQVKTIGAEDSLKCLLNTLMRLVITKRKKIEEGDNLEAQRKGIDDLLRPYLV